MPIRHTQEKACPYVKNGSAAQSGAETCLWVCPGTLGKSGLLNRNKEMAFYAGLLTQLVHLATCARTVHTFLHMLDARKYYSTCIYTLKIYFASSNPHPPHSRAYDREHGCVNSSMVFEWLGALSTCLCVKLHLFASRSRELKHEQLWRDTRRRASGGKSNSPFLSGGEKTGGPTGPISGLCLKYVLNTHCLPERSATNSLLQQTQPELQTVISQASDVEADLQAPGLLVGMQRHAPTTAN